MSLTNTSNTTVVFYFTARAGIKVKLHRKRRKENHERGLKSFRSAATRHAINMSARNKSASNKSTSNMTVIYKYASDKRSASDTRSVQSQRTSIVLLADHLSHRNSCHLVGSSGTIDDASGCGDTLSLHLISV